MTGFLLICECPASPARSLTGPKNIPQHDRIVVKLVTRSEYERDRAFACRRAQFRELIGMIVDLGRVAPAEFLPADRIMPEPFPQRRAGSNVLDPSIDACGRLSHPARPQPIDQYSRTIIRRREIIRPLEPDIARQDLLLHLVASSRERSLPGSSDVLAGKKQLAICRVSSGG